VTAKAARKSRKPRAARKAAKPAIISSGLRLGKGRDMRWQTPDGKIWASKFEADVYGWLQSRGCVVRPAESGRDTVAYTTNVRDASCAGCGGRKIVQGHTYTPDLLTSDAWPAGAGPVYWETKGYLRPKDRRILRGVHKAGVLPSLFLLLQREHAATIKWATKFLKGWKLGVWTGSGIRLVE